MTYFTIFEDFSKNSEKLYLSDPSKCRVCMKYRHSDGKLVLKVTDDNIVFKYRTEHSQDVKKVEKLFSLLMRHMSSKDTK